MSKFVETHSSSVLVKKIRATGVSLEKKEKEKRVSLSMDQHKMRGLNGQTCPTNPK
jgi:hypothetical protein